MLALILWRANRPTVIVAHELAYPWGRRGWRGFLYALTQRLVLVPLVAACDVIVVTTEQRLDWVISRRWLPTWPRAMGPRVQQSAGRDVGEDVAKSSGVGVFGQAPRRTGGVSSWKASPGWRRGCQAPNWSCSACRGRRRRRASPAEAAEAAACPICFTGVLPAPGLSESLTELTRAALLR